jgi:hypothetical protein
MTTVPDAVTLLEPVFMDMVTSTPSRFKFSASEVADALGIDTARVSQYLQTYRDVQGERHAGVTAEFVIATFNRGAGAEWFIIAWPNMDEQTAAELTTMHEILSFVREEVKPMIRNVEVQFMPSARANSVVKRGMPSVLVGKLNGYQASLMSFRNDISRVRPVVLRTSVAPMLAVLDAAIDDVDRVKLLVGSI